MEINPPSNDSQDEIKNIDLPVIQVNLIVTSKNDMPVLEVRSATSDPGLIKLLTSAAFHNSSILVIPKFFNLPKSLASLQEKGILIKDGENYFYTVDFLKSIQK